jgi:hypothetical protein
MRLLFTREWEGNPQGLLADLPDDRAGAAVAAGAAVEAASLRFKRDHAIRGRLFPANFEFDVVHDDEARKAVADGAAEYADPREAERHQGGRPAAPEPESRRARAPKAEG